MAAALTVGYLRTWASTSRPSGRVHVDAQRERLPGEHRPVQPAHARAPSGRRNDDRLLRVAVDVGEMGVALEVEARARDRLTQPQAGVDRLLALDRRVELAEQLA